MDTVAERQLLSSLGQVKLIQIYTELFKAHDLLCSQVLVTKHDFRDRQHYLNMQNCLEALLQNDIIPVVNENDVVSVTELMFTDNDELAGLMAAMLNVEAMYILTNVDGIYNGNPNDSDSKIIEVFDRAYHIIEKIASGGKSHFGRGGILTKCHTAEKIASMGIPVTIANGTAPNIILRLHNREKAGTFFPPRKATSGVKKWIAHSYSHVKGEIIVNAGARNSLLSDNARSLLPVGIMKVRGDFRKGDVIRILDEDGAEIGLGLAKYGMKKAKEIVGQKNQKPLVHYDHLYLH